MKLPRFIRILLWPLSSLYGGVAWLRASSYTRGWFQRQKLKGAVISVGNLTVGGTGKTPMVIWLAEKLVAEGKRVAVLSRGYRGTGKTSDEIELMKNRLQGRVLFGVGKDRCAEGKRLESADIDVFLLDDGFQYLRLERDVDIVLIDSTRPLRQESLIPAGRLREPRSALHRADLVVFTRTEQSTLTVGAIQKFPRLPVYPSVTKLLGFRGREPNATLQAACPDPVFAFAGIGNPEAFFADLEGWGVRVVGRRAFRDHHRYTKQELQKLTTDAQSLGAKALMTTEKDAQNIDGALPLGMPLLIAVIAIDIPDEDRFLRDLRQRLALGRGVAA